MAVSHISKGTWLCQGLYLVTSFGGKFDGWNVSENSTTNDLVFLKGSDKRNLMFWMS